MKKYIAILLICIFSAAIANANEYRAKLDKAWKDKTYATMLTTELEQNTDKSIQGYLAVAYMMNSYHAVMPWTKLNYFYKGKKLLEKSIAENPTNIELIYYRYEIQNRIPKGLNYNNISNDKTLLNEYISNQKNKLEDKELYAQIHKIINTKS